MEPQHVSPTSLRITRIYKASRDRVWKAITDPREIAKWYAPEPLTATVHTFDARPGGSFEVDLGETNGIPNRAYGKFIEVLPGLRLVQTWRWRNFPVDTEESRLIVELRDVPNGTEVTLTHERLANKESVQAHTGGWTSCLEKLGRTL